MSTELEHTTQITEKNLFDSLERLERSVYVPLVSGEAANWLANVAQAAGQAEETVCGYFRTVHPEIYAQIAERDPEQSARVQELDQKDDELCARLHSLVELAEKLRGAGESVEPDERLIAGAATELSDRVVGLVVHIRKHETEISTWHVEAMLRDRGPVD